MSGTASHNVSTTSFSISVSIEDGIDNSKDAYGVPQILDRCA